MKYKFGQSMDNNKYPLVEKDSFAVGEILKCKSVLEFPGYKRFGGLSARRDCPNSSDLFSVAALDFDPADKDKTSDIMEAVDTKIAIGVLSESIEYRNRDPFLYEVLKPRIL